MQFKELEWKDIVSDGKFVCSNCRINLCGIISMEFKITMSQRKINIFCILLAREVLENYSLIHMIL